MRNTHGDFIWYELLTTDPSGAASFYRGVLGWEVSEKVPGDIDYRQFSIKNGNASNNIGGMLAISPAANDSEMRPCWLGYIGVDDVDASVAAITTAGGALHMPARDIPGVGRIAMLSDPQGAPFYIMRGAIDAVSTVYSTTELGHCRWNELATSDPEAAQNFYFAMFGWSKGEAMDMGEMGTYQMIDQHNKSFGAIMMTSVNNPQPVWTYFFRVADIDVAAQKITQHKGTVLHGPHEIPGNEYMVLGIDPQGAAFALVGVRKER